MKKLVVALLLTMLIHTASFAATTADIYRIYGIKDIQNIEVEKSKLKELYEDLYATNRRYTSMEMMTTAQQLFESEYIKLVIEIDLKIQGVQKEIEDQLEKMKYSGDRPVATIIKEVIDYQEMTTRLQSLRKRRLILQDQVQTMRYVVPPGTVVTKQEVDQKRVQASQQKEVVTKLEEYKEIGEIENLQHPYQGPQREVTSPFGWRVDPLGGNFVEFHSGIDWATPSGTIIVSQFHGVVEDYYWSISGGNVMSVNHGNGVRTIYVHLDAPIAKVGDVVKQYQPIAYSGNTGQRTTGPHLHFGVIIGDSSYDPALLYK